MHATRPGTGFRFGTVPAGEFILDYAEAGNPEADVTLVSLPGSAGIELSPAKDLLALDRRVVEINPPGWGGKDDLFRPMHQNELGPLLAEAVTRLVERDVVLIGTSMGGCNALNVTAEMPDRVRGIVLEGSMAPARVEDLWSPPPPPPPPRPAGSATEEVEPEYPMPEPDPRKPWATADYVARQMRDRLAMFRWVEVELYPTHALEVVDRRGIPVLALLGDRDEILRPSQEQTVAAALPTSTFRLVPDGPHDLQGTVPERFVAETTTFVRSCVGGSAHTG